MSGFLAVEGVSKRFAPQLGLGDRIAARLGGAVETRAVQAVSDVSLTIDRGETLGLVGESGCGKSTLGRVIAGILEPSEGAVRLDGAPVMRRGRKVTTRVQTVFQDPFASLDPRMRIGDAILEGPLAHGLVKPGEQKGFARRWLETVGLDPDFTGRYPHQFSGGQRQRVAIARALAMNPDVLVCDEPVASLDVSIQAQIVNLFLRLRRELGLTMLFISHDLGIVRHLCDRIAVMYLGRIVEAGPTEVVYAAPAHPYTRALMEAVPRLDGGRAAFRPIAGEIPSPLDPPRACAFHPRCPLMIERCRIERPDLRPLGPGRRSACHRAEEAALSPAPADAPRRGEPCL
ncbi:MAG TPA: oligopeptide/dipeptide ABC transporter ATP-binding protein [Beijerinckiaceae bacterium]